MTVRAFSHEALSRVRVFVGRKLPELRWQVSRSRGTTHIHNIPIIMLFIPLGVGFRIQEYVCPHHTFTPCARVRRPCGPLTSLDIANERACVARSSD